MYAPCIMKEINNIYSLNVVTPQLRLPLSMVIVDSDMVIWHVSLGETSYLIISLVSVWSSPLCDMSVCPLLISNSCL